jgi:hypothetical protein
MLLLGIYCFLILKIIYLFPIIFDLWITDPQRTDPIYLKIRNFSF